MKFDSLGLCAPILKAIAAKGYNTASPIQREVIPNVLSGRDVMACAATGTGKTAGFTLPILELLERGEPAEDMRVRALILTPTRELAAQVADNVSVYGENLTLTSAVVFGGVKINPQIRRLKCGVDILIATPGRLLDLYQNNAVRFDKLEVLVFDEADRMLDMGFIHDIRKIMALLPKHRQSLMFSATFSDKIKKLAKSLLNNPIEVSIEPKVTTALSVIQSLCPVDKKKKPALLAHLIHENRWEQVLVFSRTKHGANKLVKFLESEKITAAAIHSNKSQNARTQALAEFKNNEVRVLVATDIAARGLDIHLLPHVINMDLPQVPEDYVHRIGRTGRASASGEAISLVCADEFELLSAIEKQIKKMIPRNYVNGFEPVHDLPPSNLNAPQKHEKRSNYPNTEKKPKVGHRDGQRRRRSASRRPWK